MLTTPFFDQDACQLAQMLLGKVIRHRYNSHWLAAQIIEAEAYYVHEKGSHSSLGHTEKRRAMFMPAGTIYMYYARGGDSLNISCRGEGNAVLIKSGYPYVDGLSPEKNLALMQQLNPVKGSHKLRPLEKLCAGQTLLCRSLGLKVTDWDQEHFNKDRFYIEDCGYTPEKMIQTTRMGIPDGRDGHLMYRFIDHAYARFCSSNPLTKRAWKQDQDYRIHDHVPVSC